MPNPGERAGISQAYVETTGPRVASSATVVTLLAANANRRGATFYNSGTGVLYLKNGSGASLTDFKVPLVSGAYYELPQPIYTGIITGIWDAANGYCYPTETV